MSQESQHQSSSSSQSSSFGSYRRLAAAGLILSGVATVAATMSMRVINFLHQGQRYQLRVRDDHLGNMVEAAISSGVCGVEYINSTRGEYSYNDVLPVPEGMQFVRGYRINELRGKTIVSSSVIQFINESSQQAQQGFLDCLNGFLNISRQTWQGVDEDRIWNMTLIMGIGTVLLFVTICAFGSMSCFQNNQNDQLRFENRQLRLIQAPLNPSLAQQQNDINLTSFLKEEEKSYAERFEVIGADLSRSPYQNFICPITHKIMTYPVIASDGHSYEYKAIKDHFESALNLNDPNPISSRANVRLESKTLKPNWALKNTILGVLEELEKNHQAQQEKINKEDASSSSIRKLKTH